MFSQVSQQIAEESTFQSVHFILRRGCALLVLLEITGDVSFSICQRLLARVPKLYEVIADVLGTRLLALIVVSRLGQHCLADFQVVTEHAVIPDFQALYSAAFALLSLQGGNPGACVTNESSQLIELT